MLVVSCGSPPPGSVDEELLLVDLEACARGDIVCQKSGSVSAVEGLLSEKTAVRMNAGASITLPLHRNEGRKLAWVAIGLRAEGGERKLAVTVTGTPGAVAVPNWGWSRVEIAQGDAMPPADARLTLIAEGGTFDLLWVVGRWKRE
jgi:hypothetical protein